MNNSKPRVFTEVSETQRATPLMYLAETLVRLICVTTLSAEFSKVMSCTKEQHCFLHDQLPIRSQNTA